MNLCFFSFIKVEAKQQAEKAARAYRLEADQKEVASILHSPIMLETATFRRDSPNRPLPTGFKGFSSEQHQQIHQEQLHQVEEKKVCLPQTPFRHKFLLFHLWIVVSGRLFNNGLRSKRRLRPKSKLNIVGFRFLQSVKHKDNEQLKRKNSSGGNWNKLKFIRPKSMPFVLCSSLSCD